MRELDELACRCAVGITVPTGDSAIDEETAGVDVFLCPNCDAVHLVLLALGGTHQTVAWLEGDQAREVARRLMNPGDPIDMGQFKNKVN